MNSREGADSNLGQVVVTGGDGGSRGGGGDGNPSHFVKSKVKSKYFKLILI